PPPTTTTSKRLWNRMILLRFISGCGLRRSAKTVQDHTPNPSALEAPARSTRRPMMMFHVKPPWRWLFHVKRYAGRIQSGRPAFAQAIDDPHPLPWHVGARRDLHRSRDPGGAG